jgi:N-acetylmuramoyl-L-alanine amidase
MLLAIYVPKVGFGHNTMAPGIDTAAAVTDKSTLEYFDVQCEKLSQQMIIKGANAITCKKQLDAIKHQLIIDIQGLTINDIDRNMIQSKAKPLQEIGCLQEVNFAEHAPNSTRMIFTFVPHKLIHDAETNSMVKTKNKFLIRSCSYKKSLTIDIFSEQALQKIIHKDSYIKLAANDVHHTDYGPNIASPLKPLRIMIDPGHGGSDLGAASHHNLLEKDVTLAISQEVHKLLKAQGHNVYLTRSQDSDLSLAERTSIATQLQTDFMVSIHANSSGKKLSAAKGLETYYFPAQELQNKEALDFMFINCPKDTAIINELQCGIRSRVNLSYNLAKTVHESVLSSMSKSKHGPVNNRGIKADHFRLFLKNHIPCALVEVGFLTNKEEAEKLSQKAYRQNIAVGIANGINSFISAANADA